MTAYSFPASFYEECRRGKAQARYMKRMKVKDLAGVTVDTWLGGARYLLPDNRSDLTIYNQQLALVKFRRRYGKQKVRAITVIQAQAWALKYPASVPFLRRAWRQAVRMQVAEIDIWTGLVMPARKKPKPRAPSADEMQAMLDNCRYLACTEGGWWKSFEDFLVVAAHTGARRAGMIDMLVDAVDLDGCRLSLTEKGNKTRLVVMAGPALDSMMRQFRWRAAERWHENVPRPRGAEPHVWLAWNGRPFTPKSLSEAWLKVRGDFPFGIHTLKHYAATWLKARGVDPLDIAVQLGHVDEHGRPYPELVERVYVHHDADAALRRLQAKIEGRSDVS